MQLLLDLPKENIEDLKKAVKIIEVVIKNKESGEIFSKGLDQFQEQKPAVPEWLNKKPEVKEKVVVEEVKPSSPADSPAARSLQEQKKMIGSIDLSSILRKKK